MTRRDRMVDLRKKIWHAIETSGYHKRRTGEIDKRELYWAARDRMCSALDELEADYCKEQAV